MLFSSYLLKIRADIFEEAENIGRLPILNKYGRNLEPLISLEKTEM